MSARFAPPPDGAEAPGAAPVAVLSRLPGWEANLILNLRLWCAGPEGQARVRADYHSAFPETRGRRAFHSFETLLGALLVHAHRPLVRHQVGCACVGADEAVFVHLLRTASAGDLGDASLIATLLIGPAQAEQVALLAAQVGTLARQMPGASGAALARQTGPLH